jgi:hypothetical protein
MTVDFSQGTPRVEAPSLLPAKIRTSFAAASMYCVGDPVYYGMPGLLFPPPLELTFP